MTAATLRIYYDYTCRYSYRAMHWLDQVRVARPDLSVDWATFSLKEVNRAEGEPPWVDAGSPPSISILALALAHAARSARSVDFDRYHRTVFEAMQGEGRHLSEQDLLAIAREAGVDVDSFDRPRWTASVGAEHREAVARWGVYGTPTPILDQGAAYMRLTEVPGSPDQAAGLLDALNGLAASTVNLVEFFRPEVPTPAIITIEGPSQDG